MVKSEGEYYTNVEQALCKGLNKRLALKNLAIIILKRMNMRKQTGPIKIIKWIIPPWKFIKEHGTTWIYCNPQDHVIGSTPLCIIGWQGLPHLYA